MPEAAPLSEDERARLTELETRFAQTLTTEKLASLAEFAAGAGHEMNNPLAVIAGRAQMLLRDESHPERRRELAIIHAQALRVHEMIADLMLFARPPTPERRPCDLAKLIDQVRSELAPQATSQQTRLTMQGHEQPCDVLADPVQLTVALRALVVNALEALHSTGYAKKDNAATSEHAAQSDKLVEIELRSTPGEAMITVRDVDMLSTRSSQAAVQVVDLAMAWPNAGGSSPTTAVVSKP